MRRVILQGVLRTTPLLRRIAAGYAAKCACSALFVAGRELDGVIAEDLETVPGAELEVDRERRVVRARVQGCERVARYHEGLGGQLVEDGDPVSLPELPARAPRPEPDAPWPRGEGAEPLESADLDRVLDEAFSEPDPLRPRRTRAVVVVHRGRLVRERYAPGFGPDTPLLGWSMTKSLTNALCGVVAQRGQLDVRQPLPAPEWAGGDRRAAITFDMLLRMSGGLRFWEQYWNPFSHVSSMLFHQPGAAAYAASFPLVADPDTRWSYASGSSNLLARGVRQVMGGDHEGYLDLPRSGLFERIGMHSARMEVDASGHFVGSSFSYATARDWARFGQLYLQDGIWEGERIFPEGWVSYTRRPTPAAPLGDYGAHFWLNAGAPGRPDKRIYPQLPADAFFARGYEEQSVSIVPSREAVIVRLGQTQDRAAWSLESFVAGVLNALPR